MMFAVAIGEIGLQAANLVQYEGSYRFFLPAYTHLILAMVVIAASWVGWTLSPSPGARHDVSGIFEAEFLVLIVDVVLVIIYFILVRTVDFQRSENGAGPEFRASVLPETLWIFVIFCVYFVWDFLTKIIVFVIRKLKGAKDENSWSYYATRMIPTIVCVLLAFLAHKYFSGNFSPAQVVLADFALISLVLLFRAGKELVSVFFPTKRRVTSWWKQFLAVVFTILMIAGISLSCLWIYVWPHGALEDFINDGNRPADVKFSIDNKANQSVRQFEIVAVRYDLLVGLGN
jgi:hypothetical protein